MSIEPCSDELLRETVAAHPSKRSCEPCQPIPCLTTSSAERWPQTRALFGRTPGKAPSGVAFYQTPGLICPTPATQ